MKLYVRKRTSRLSEISGRRWAVEMVGVDGPYRLATFRTHSAALSFALWKVGAQRNYAEVSDA